MRPETYRFGIERGMQRSFSVLAVILAMLWTVITVTSSARLDTLTILSAGLFVLVLFVEALRAWRCLLAAADVWATCGAVLLVYAAMVFSRPDAFVVGARGNPALVGAILAAGFLPPVRAWALCVAVCLGQFAACLPLDGPSGALESLWPVVAGAFAAGVLTRVMRSAAARADQAQESLLSARAVEARAEGRLAAHRTFQRMLHDDVASALRAVAGRGVTRAEARRTCADALAALSRAPAVPVTSTRNLARDIEGLGDVLPVETTFHVEGDIPVPAPVATAMLDAAREALRNVDRHAFASAVSVRLSEHGHDVVLTVSDDGVGFTPARSHGSSWGLSRSVIDRMAEVGGTAEVFSSAGAGTSVRLRWTRDAQAPPVAVAVPDRAALIALAVGDVRKPLAAVCVPYLLSMYAIAVIYNDGSAGANRLTLWYSAVVLITLALIARADRPLSGWLGLAGSTVALTGLVYGLTVIPDDSLDDFGSWPIGALAPLFVVLLTVRSTWEAVVPLLLEELAVLTLIATGGLTAGSAGTVLPALLAPVSGVVMVWIIVRTIAALGAVVSGADRAQIAITVAGAAQEARFTLHQRRTEEIGAELLPFLREIATGQETHPWRELREQARLLETTTRDELHLPGVLDAEVRSRLGAARQAGCLVTFQSDTDAVDPPLVLRELLATALAGPEPPRQLTLSLYPGAEQMEVSLVTVPGDAARSARLRRFSTDFTPVVDDLPEATCTHLAVHQVHQISH